MASPTSGSLQAHIHHRLHNSKKRSATTSQPDVEEKEEEKAMNPSNSPPPTKPSSKAARHNSIHDPSHRATELQQPHTITPAPPTILNGSTLGGIDPLSDLLKHSSIEPTQWRIDREAAARARLKRERRRKREWERRREMDRQLRQRRCEQGRNLDGCSERIAYSGRNPALAHEEETLLPPNDLGEIVFAATASPLSVTYAVTPPRSLEAAFYEALPLSRGSAFDDDDDDDDGDGAEGDHGGREDFWGKLEVAWKASCECESVEERRDAFLRKTPRAKLEEEG